MLSEVLGITDLPSVSPFERVAAVAYPFGRPTPSALRKARRLSGKRIMATPTTFEDLKAFILDRNRMRMTHVYKPVMLQAVLRRRGAATKEAIASEIMSRDELQIEHYRRNIVHQMPGSRLIRDGVLKQDGDSYRLASPSDRLAEWQRLDLIAACERRLEEHRASYGDNFSSRSTDAVVGSVRYEALKRAGGRCELCGVSHEVRPLHVDHVRPRAKGGSNDLRNLQVLC